MRLPSISQFLSNNILPRTSTRLRDYWEVVVRNDSYKMMLPFPDAIARLGSTQQPAQILPAPAAPYLEQPPESALGRKSLRAQPIVRKNECQVPFMGGTLEDDGLYGEENESVGMQSTAGAATSYGGAFPVRKVIDL